MGLREPDEIKMAWTEITRAQYRRDDLEYASDLRAAEWALIAPLMPEKKRPGRPRLTDLRRVVEAILHIVTTGCQWRQLSGTFRPSRPYRAISTVGSAGKDGKS